MNPHQFPQVYHGSVKEVWSPLQWKGHSESPIAVFDYTDAFSVFDWGKMPDLISLKGESLATVAADLFERIQNPMTWQEFSRSSEALALRKASRFGAAFNEWGERLKQDGLKTHYLGTIPARMDLFAPALQIEPENLSVEQGPVKRLAVQAVQIVKPQWNTVMGRSVPDYAPVRAGSRPQLIPLEVIFRFSCPPGGSLPERIKKGGEVPIGLFDSAPGVGQTWDFPLLEMFSKLEPSDRPLSLSEALAISGILPSQLEELLIQTAWVAGYLRAICSRAGLELADGKLEWAVSAGDSANPAGSCFLVDAIGPDELRILKGDIQLSKEFIRDFYRDSVWYQSVAEAKQRATQQGYADWKRAVKESPPLMPARLKEAVSQMYRCLTHSLSGKTWFKNTWDLETLVTELKALRTWGGQ